MSEKRVRLDDLMPLIRESLERGQDVTFSPRGTSMLPFLKEGRDSVTLSAPPSKLKKYDIPLYQRKNGQYVLHRVIRIGETYTCIGDNQFAYETGVEQGQIIAVCSSVVRDGKKIIAGSFRWRFYAGLWHYSRFPRYVIFALRCKIKRLWKKN